eukprot:1667741-Prymnesium_polylepis.1
METDGEEGDRGRKREIEGDLDRWNVCLGHPEPAQGTLWRCEHHTLASAVGVEGVIRRPSYCARSSVGAARSM